MRSRWLGCVVCVAIVCVGVGVVVGVGARARVGARDGGGDGVGVAVGVGVDIGHTVLVTRCPKETIRWPLWLSFWFALASFSDPISTISVSRVCGSISSCV